MLTKTDLKSIKQLISDAVDDGNKELIEAFSKFHIATKKELEEKIITFKDQILVEIKKLQEDTTTVSGYKDQIENHEKRLDKLEKILQS